MVCPKCWQIPQHFYFRTFVCKIVLRSVLSPGPIYELFAARHRERHSHTRGSSSSADTDAGLRDGSRVHRHDSSSRRSHSHHDSRWSWHFCECFQHDEQNSTLVADTIPPMLAIHPFFIVTFSFSFLNGLRTFMV